jgi:SET domain-containing protein
MGQKVLQIIKPIKVYVAPSKICSGLGIFAKKEIKKNEIIFKFEGKIVYQDYTNISMPYALQLDFNKYLLPEGNYKYINHSCSPNSYVKLIDDKLYLIACKNIKKDEEITYNYNTSEFDMGVDAFECLCKSPNCYKVIKGFKYLPLDEKIKLKPYLLPYLKRYLSEEIKNKKLLEK